VINDYADFNRETMTFGVMLSQLNRNGVGEPGEADLKESGALEEGADRIALVWRPNKHRETNPSAPDHTRIKVPKIRHGGQQVWPRSFASVNGRLIPAESTTTNEWHDQ